MTRQGFNTVDVLRLEVEIEPTGPYNRLPSSQGAYGAWGWLTPLANSAITGSGPSVQYSGPTGSYFTSDNMPVTPGHWAAIRYGVPGPIGSGFGNYGVRLEWYDANLAFISVTALGATNAAPGTYTYASQQAPANARFMRLRADLNAGTGVVILASAVVATASTQAAIDAAIGTVAVSSGANWRNVIGPSSNIRVVRETLNLGVLEAEILDSTLDPATTPDLRPGREVRLSTIDGGGVWQLLFVGKADVLEVDYDAKRVPARAPRVKIVATDRTARIAAAVRPQGVATLAELPAVLEGAGIPWNVNGNTSHVKVWTPIGNNEKATALDQVALARDTTLGGAWVSRDGVLVARDYMPDPVIPNPGAETNTTGWSAGSGTALARVTTPVKSGVGAFRLTQTSGTLLSMGLPVGLAGLGVVGGQMYTAKAWFRAAAVTGRTCQIVWAFWDAAGATVNYDVNLYPASLSNVASSTSAYVESTYTIRAPANARYAALTCYVSGVGAGEVHYVDDVSITALIEADLTEPNYSGLDIGFRSTDCVNSVSVEVLAYDPVAGSTTPVVFGPYEDAVSIAQWGRRTPSKPYTVHGIAQTDAAASAYAAKILARNNTPTLAVRGLTIPMRSAADRVHALRDLGDRVRVRHVGKAIDRTLRVASVEHIITAEPAKWLTRLGFDEPSSVAAPTVVPPAADLIPPLGDTAWIPLTLINGWTDWDTAGWGVAAVRRLNGIVYMRGLVKQTVAGQAAFTVAVIPAGFRPSTGVMFDEYTGAGQTRMDVAATGHVTYPVYGAINNFSSLVAQWPEATQ